MSEIMISAAAGKVLVAGSLGTAVGMVIGGGRIWERVARVFVGGVTLYVGYHIAAKIVVGLLSLVLPRDFLPAVEEVEPAMAFILGMIGMIACQAAINAMTAVRDTAGDFVDHRMGGHSDE